MRCKLIAIVDCSDLRIVYSVTPASPGIDPVFRAYEQIPVLDETDAC